MLPISTGFQYSGNYAKLKPYKNRNDMNERNKARDILVL